MSEADYEAFTDQCKAQLFSDPLFSLVRASFPQGAREAAEGLMLGVYIKGLLDGVAGTVTFPLEDQK